MPIHQHRRSLYALYDSFFIEQFLEFAPGQSTLGTFTCADQSLFCLLLLYEKLIQYTAIEVVRERQAHATQQRWHQIVNLSIGSTEAALETGTISIEHTIFMV